MYSQHSTSFHRVPEGVEDVSKYPYIFAELLLDPKWTDEDLKKLAGMNLIRVFQEAERVSCGIGVFVSLEFFLGVKIISDRIGLDVAIIRESRRYAISNSFTSFVYFSKLLYLI